MDENGFVIIVTCYMWYKFPPVIYHFSRVTEASNSVSRTCEVFLTSECKMNTILMTFQLIRREFSGKEKDEQSFQKWLPVCRLRIACAFKGL
jgi:hypothetical protein